MDVLAGYLTIIRASRSRMRGFVVGLRENLAARVCFSGLWRQIRQSGPGWTDSLEFRRLAGGLRTIFAGSGGLRRTAWGFRI